MNSVIVIGTGHSEGGACNSEELFKIIDKISPEVVFCEVSPKKFPLHIKRIDVKTPEMEVIKKIINENFVKLVPIDVEHDPFDRRLEDMFALFKQKMKFYLNAHNMLLNETYLKGFPFLNSEDSDKIFRDMESMGRHYLEMVKYQALSDYYADWIEWNDKRENQWIDLIHNYFEIHKPKKAVFLVGAGHRFRLMDKIQNIREKNELICNWNFFS
ncbi:MAG: hypothetical protein R2797_05355 [Gelidibacter sp.]